MEFRTSRQKHADFFFALAHPRRLKILEVLAEHPKGITFERIAEIAKIPKTALVHHMKPIRSAGLTNRKVRGRHTIYALDQSALSGQMRPPIGLETY